MIASLFTLLFPYRKIIAYAFIGFVALGSVYGIYRTWEHSIQTKALVEYNQKQSEQMIRDTQKFINDTMNILKEANRTIDSVNSQLDQIEKSRQETIEAISGEEDRPSSPILKETFRRLK